MVSHDTQYNFSFDLVSGLLGRFHMTTKCIKNIKNIVKWVVHIQFKYRIRFPLREARLEKLNNKVNSFLKKLYFKAKTLNDLETLSMVKKLQGIPKLMLNEVLNKYLVQCGQLGSIAKM